MDAKARLNFAIISPSSVDEEKVTWQALEVEEHPEIWGQRRIWDPSKRHKY